MQPQQQSGMSTENSSNRMLQQTIAVNLLSSALPSSAADKVTSMHVGSVAQAVSACDMM
jgi:hypothetical protein